MSGHWCETHQTDYFKTPKMKTYAHPVKDATGKTLGWCNEPEGAAPTQQETTPADKPFEPQINQQKQTSIETQHAITKVVELRVGNVIDDDDPLYKAALSYIKDRVMGADNRVTQKATSPLVEAAKDAGAEERRPLGQWQ